MQACCPSQQPQQSGKAEPPAIKGETEAQRREVTSAGKAELELASSPTLPPGDVGPSPVSASAAQDNNQWGRRGSGRCTAGSKVGVFRGGASLVVGGLLGQPRGAGQSCSGPRWLLGRPGQGGCFLGGSAGWFPPTTQAGLPGAAGLIGGEAQIRAGGLRRLVFREEGCQWAEIGEPLGRGAGADTRQMKQRSRKQEKQKTLIKCRVGEGGGKEGG